MAKKDLTIDEALSLIQKEGYVVSKRIKDKEELFVNEDEDELNVPFKPRKVGKDNIEINLLFPQSINGKQYGPGKVITSQKIAQVLLEQQQRFIAQSKKLEEEPQAAYLIQMRETSNGDITFFKQPVPLSTFGNELSIIPPSFEVT